MIKKIDHTKCPFIFSYIEARGEYCGYFCCLWCHKPMENKPSYRLRDDGLAFESIK